MAVLTFISVIKREGEAGSIRGKIPAGLVKALNVNEGDGIEFQVRGTTLVGANVLQGKALRLALKEKAAEAPASKSSKPKSVAKATPKASTPAPVKKGGKKPKPVQKGSKRKTEVAYEAPVVPRKKGGMLKRLKGKK
jgi:antitoxin component of MazEF toxin-antitoxin module